MKQKTITVVLAKPGVQAKAIEVANDLAAFQKLVGGYIEAKPARSLSKGRTLLYVWDEDGTMKTPPPLPNRFTEYGRIFGPLFVVAQKGPEFVGLTPDEVKRALTQLNGGGR